MIADSKTSYEVPFIWMREFTTVDAVTKSLSINNGYNTMCVLY